MKTQSSSYQAAEWEVDNNCQLLLFIIIMGT